MNIFCYPGISKDRRLASLLNIDLLDVPEFGFRPLVPLQRGLEDQTEIDMKLGSLFVEAKLTEGGFQTACLKDLTRYRDLATIFDVNELPRKNRRFEGYQVIRGILAAFARDASFCLMCDVRRQDLIEIWFSVMRAVRGADLRCRVKLVTWQEIAASTPRVMQIFLNAKYGFGG